MTEFTDSYRYRSFCAYRFFVFEVFPSLFLLFGFVGLIKLASSQVLSLHIITLYITVYCVVSYVSPDHVRRPAAGGETDSTGERPDQPHLINLIILLTYPTNFFIYCAMSTQTDRATTQRDCVTTHRDCATTQGDRATTQRDCVTTQRDRATTQRDRATMQRDCATTQRDCVTTQRDCATTQGGRRDNAEGPNYDGQGLRDDAEGPRDDAGGLHYDGQGPRDDGEGPRVSTEDATGRRDSLRLPKTRRDRATLQ